MRIGKGRWVQYLLGWMLVACGLEVACGHRVWGQDAPLLVINRGIPIRTTDSTPTISGVSKAPAGSQVSVEINGETHSTTVSPGGTWTLDWPTPLAPGVY